MLKKKKKEKATGRRGVLKASSLDPGRVMNEANYLVELRQRAERLGGYVEGFACVLGGPWQLDLDQHHHPGMFIMEELDHSAKDVSLPWSWDFARRVGLRLIQCLEVMHTQDRTLGLCHCDIKPANVMLDVTHQRIVLIDLDCCCAIPSVAPRGGVKKSNPHVRVEGTMMFTGTDAMLGLGQSPKSDVESVGLLMLWGVNGGVLPWSHLVNRVDVTKAKEMWRNTVWRERDGIIGEMEEYFGVVEKMRGGAVTERAPYEQLCKILGDNSGNNRWSKGKEIMMSNEEERERERDDDDVSNKGVNKGNSSCNGGGGVLLRRRDGETRVWTAQPLKEKKQQQQQQQQQQQHDDDVDTKQQPSRVKKTSSTKTKTTTTRGKKTSTPPPPSLSGVITRSKVSKSDQRMQQEAAQFATDLPPRRRNATKK